MQEITYANFYGKSITFGRSPPFFLEKLDQSIGVSRDSQKAIGQNGQTTLGVLYQARTIMLSLAFIGLKNNRYDWEEMRKNWLKIGNVFIPDKVGTLYYKNDGGSYKIQCMPIEMPDFDVSVATLGKFKLQLVADNPFWLTKQDFISKLGQTIGGIKYPLRYPLQYGKIIREAVIEIDLNMPIPCTIEVQTAAAYIRIVNNTTGEFIRIDRPLNNNQKMIVNTEDATVAIVELNSYGGEKSREYANYRITLDSRYFLLAVGENRITIENGAADSPCPASIIYNRRYVIV